MIADATTPDLEARLEALWTKRNLSPHEFQRVSATIDAIEKELDKRYLTANPDHVTVAL